MKNSVLFIVLISIIMVSLFTGCIGVPYEEYGAAIAEAEAAKEEASLLQSENSSLESEVTTVKSQLTTLQDDYNSLSIQYEEVAAQLAQMEEVYPPRWFSSERELRDWMERNDVSVGVFRYMEDYYRKGLEIHRTALNDGYMVFVSLDTDYESETWAVECMTLVDGDLYSWFVGDDYLYNLSYMYDFVPIE